MTLIKWSEEAGQVRLGLPSDLDLAMAQPLTDSLRHGLGTSNDVLVHADAVERVSTACVQALLAASRHAGQSGQSFIIAKPSEALAEACDDLGLSAWLKQWSQS
ncbi:STAS domain-containing protein [Azospirillum sp.]|uniref:STAS domain-containing protein n=1 Tax=Azospirillum sp. TaxID=34012 RepID=UPI003D7400D1